MYFAMSYLFYTGRPIKLVCTKLVYLALWITNYAHNIYKVHYLLQIKHNGVYSHDQACKLPRAK